METLLWIIGSSLIMCAIALVGSVTFFMRETTLHKFISFFMAIAAGSLLGGAFFHLLPAGVEEAGPSIMPYIWVAIGFSVFLLLEQFLHWHHCHDEVMECRTPLSYLILIGDGLHNFIDGGAVAGAFLVDIRLGIMAWIAAASHEVLQELGDFAVLLHGGWSKSRALLFNFLSALTFLLGGLIAYSASLALDVTFLLPFAAGNFIYIAASDLVPEMKKHRSMTATLNHLAVFACALLFLLFVRLVFPE
jgi:zinc and cadmium transporter